MNQLSHADKVLRIVVFGGGKLEPLFSLSFSLQMINIEVVMEEKGRDAMALLSLMIGLSDCCNGLGCQGQ